MGYVGTMALYAYTFGVYGSAMLGDASSLPMHHLLESLVLLAFLDVNFYGVKAIRILVSLMRGMTIWSAVPP